MRFNIKTAMEYSSKLKNLTNDVENSLGVSNALVNRYDNDSTDVPATTNGLYNATVTHKKASLNKVLGKVLEDEVLDKLEAEDIDKYLDEQIDEVLNIEDSISEEQRDEIVAEIIKQKEDVLTVLHELGLTKIEYEDKYVEVYNKVDALDEVEGNIFYKILQSIKQFAIFLWRIFRNIFTSFFEWINSVYKSKSPAFSFIIEINLLNSILLRRCFNGTT